MQSIHLIKKIDPEDEPQSLKKDISEMAVDIKFSNKDLKSFKKALDESAIVAITDRDGTITYVNDMFCKISKYSGEELLGQNHRIPKSGFHSPKFFENLWKTISSGKIWKGDIKNKAKDGSFYWVKTIIMPILGENGKPEQYIALRTDITKYKKTEEKLEDSLDELKKKDIQKEKFVTMVTHDLKNLLTPIQLYCELLKDPEGIGPLNPEQLDAVDEIEQTNKKINRLVSDIHDIHRLDMKQMKFNKEVFNVNQLFDSITKNHLPMMNLRKVQLVNNSPHKFLTITGDKDRVFQVFSNLIKNAIDFLPKENPRIEIGAMYKDQYVIFYVKDNGVGIPAAEQEKLFREFFQVEEINKGMHIGSGLGLTICKGIVEGMGGRLWIDSKEGIGTTFYFSIPKEVCEK